MACEDVHSQGDCTQHDVEDGHEGAAFLLLLLADHDLDDRQQRAGPAAIEGRREENGQGIARFAGPRVERDHLLLENERRGLPLRRGPGSGVRFRLVHAVVIARVDGIHANEVLDDEYDTDIRFGGAVETHLDALADLAAVWRFGEAGAIGMTKGQILSFIFSYLSLSVL